MVRFFLPHVHLFGEDRAPLFSFKFQEDLWCLEFVRWRWKSHSSNDNDHMSLSWGETCNWTRCEVLRFRADYEELISSMRFPSRVFDRAQESQSCRILCINRSTLLETNMYPHQKGPFESMIFCVSQKWDMFFFPGGYWSRIILGHGRNKPVGLSLISS